MLAGALRRNDRRATHGEAVAAARVVRRAEGRALRARDRRDGHGWAKGDPDFDTNAAKGDAVAVEMKKRPMGVTRFAPNDPEEGKGAMVAEMHEKGRYPGDPRGQCAVGGVKMGYVVKSIGGQECIGWNFEDIMDLLEDYEPDYNLTQELKAKWEARPRNHQAAELPVVVEFVECPVSDAGAAAAPVVREEGKWYPRAGGFSDQELEAERQRAKKEFPVPAGYRGVVYAGPGSVDEAWIKAFIVQQRTGTLLPKQMAYELVIDAIKALQKEKTMSEITVPEKGTLTVCGDLHGQYWDLMNIFEMNGTPSDSNPYLFNGDFVDRGSWSMENICLLFALKVKYPGSVHMNRGNHELIEANLIYGFCGEVFKKYDGPLFDLFSESFRNLSLCHLINKQVFVTHGGLPGPNPRQWLPGQSHDPEDAIPVNVSSTTLKQIAAVDRFTELQSDTYANAVGEADAHEEETRIVIDLLWADPRGGAGYGPSYRKSKGIFMFGPDVTDAFCKQNDLKMVIRSHEVKHEGWQQDHPNLMTVFSAPDYMDTGGNNGAFLKLTNVAGELQISPTSFGKCEHPPLAPMVWQEFMAEMNPHLTKKMKKQEGIVTDSNGMIVKQLTVFDQGDSDFDTTGLTAAWVEDDDAAGTVQRTREEIEAEFDAKYTSVAYASK